MFENFVKAINNSLKKERRLGYESGKKLGYRDGAYDKAIETAKKMLKARLQIEQIVEFTGLPIKKIEELKKEIE